MLASMHEDFVSVAAQAFYELHGGIMSTTENHCLIKFLQLLTRNSSLVLIQSMSTRAMERNQIYCAITGMISTTSLDNWSVPNRLPVNSSQRQPETETLARTRFRTELTMQVPPCEADYMWS